MQKQSADYLEKTSHGDRLFPVSYHLCTIPETYRSLPLHWHEEAEVTYIEEGCATYTVHLESFSVQKGDLLFISPQVLHGAAEKPGHTMTSHSLVFHMSYLGSLTPDICTIKYLNPLLSGKCHFTPVIHPDHPGYPELKNHFLEACRLFQSKEMAYELRTKALLLALLSELYAFGCTEQADSKSDNQHTENKLKEVLLYMQTNYRENLSIRELAGVCHLSETYFMNFFRRYTGTTCVEYLNRYRLSKAAVALEETDASVMEIALENGFRNISYFNKLFKRQFGCTPGKYRKSESGR